MSKISNQLISHIDQQWAIISNKDINHEWQTLVNGREKLMTGKQ